MTIDFAALCARYGLTPEETADCYETLFGPGGAWEGLSQRLDDDTVLVTTDRDALFRALAEYER